MNTKQLALEALKQAVELLYSETCYTAGGDPLSSADTLNDRCIVKMQAAIAALEADLAQPVEPAGWQPIATAPKDGTPVDLWRRGERLTNMRRVELAPDNVFYEPVESGYSCVRDATHFMKIPPAPKDAS